MPYCAVPLYCRRVHRRRVPGAAVLQQPAGGAGKRALGGRPPACASARRRSTFLCCDYRCPIRASPPAPHPAQIWVYGSSLESSLVAVVVPKKQFVDQHPGLGSQEAKKAMLAVSCGAGAHPPALTCPPGRHPAPMGPGGPPAESRPAAAAAAACPRARVRPRARLLPCGACPRVSGHAALRAARRSCLPRARPRSSRALRPSGVCTWWRSTSGGWGALAGAGVGGGGWVAGGSQRAGQQKAGALGAGCSPGPVPACGPRPSAPMCRPPAALPLRPQHRERPHDPQHEAQAPAAAAALPDRDRRHVPRAQGGGGCARLSDARARQAGRGGAEPLAPLLLPLLVRHGMATDRHQWNRGHACNPKPTKLPSPNFFIYWFCCLVSAMLG